MNRRREVLLFLRDDFPGIPYPNTWDVPGGHVEPGETPEECIVREMREEMEMELEDFRLFKVMEFDDRFEYAFWKRAELDIEKSKLHEGQKLKWFNEEEVRDTTLAYGFNELLEDFFAQVDFLCVHYGFV